MGGKLWYKVMDALAPIAKRSEEDGEDVYRALCNVAWVDSGVKATTYGELPDNLIPEEGVAFAISWRAAGGMVSAMRGGSDYMEFYCSGNEGSLTDEIVGAMKKIGLRPIS